MNLTFRLVIALTIAQLARDCPLAATERPCHFTRSQHSSPGPESDVASGFVESLTSSVEDTADKAATRLMCEHFDALPAVVEELQRQPLPKQKRALWSLLGATHSFDDHPEHEHRVLATLKPFIPQLIEQCRVAKGGTDALSHSNISAKDISRGIVLSWLGILVGHAKPPDHELEPVICVFRELLQHESWYVRDKTMEGLIRSEHLGEPRVARALIPDLTRLVKNDSESHDVRRRACVALGALGPDAAASVSELLAVIDEPGLGWLAEVALYRIAPDILEESGKGKLPQRVIQRYCYMMAGETPPKQPPPKQKSQDGKLDKQKRGTAEPPPH